MPNHDVRGTIGTCAAAVLVASSAPVAWAAAKPDFTGIGQVPGGWFSHATRVSSDGSVVTGWGYTAVNEEKTIVWTRAGGLHTLDGFGGGGSHANGVSGDGAVVVGGAAAAPGQSSLQPYRSTQAGPIQQLPVLKPLNGGGGAVDATHDGSVVVGYADDPIGWQPVKWTSAGIQRIPLLTGTERGQAAAVSDDGKVITGFCYATNSSAPFPFRWTALFGTQSIPGPFGTTPKAISNDGKIIVGEGQPGGLQRAMRWQSGTGWVDLGHLPGGNFSSAYDTNGDGSIVVGYAQTGTNEQCFVWTQALGMVSLRQYLTLNNVHGFDGWTLTETDGISADGKTIVGYGQNPGGATEAFVATIPAPGGLVAGSLGVGVGLGVRRRRKG